MIAHRADLGSGSPDDDMAAVAAFPHGDAALFKDGLGLNIIEQLAIAILMRFLDSCDLAEPLRKLRKAFFIGFDRHAVVHVGPLEVLAFGSMEQVLLTCAETAQSLKPELRMFLLIFRRYKEDCRYLLVSCLHCNGCKIGILVAGH